MSDIYDFEKSNLIQGVDRETPYEKKDWQWIPDINAGVYNSAGLTLVNFDLSSIYNSAFMADMCEGFITVPLCYTALYTASTSAGTPVPPTNGDWARVGLKAGYFNLLHASDIQSNGQTIEDYQAFINPYIAFKLLSEMSTDDQATFGQTIGMGPILDSARSLKFNQAPIVTGNFDLVTAVGPKGGNGMTNCAPFPIGGVSGNQGDQTLWGQQNNNTTTYNAGLYKRLSKILDVGYGNASGASGLYGTSAVAGVGMNAVLTQQQCITEFDSTYQVLNTNYMCWQDIAIIRLQDIYDSMKKMPLATKLNSNLRLYFNTGSLAVNSVSSAPGAVNGSMVFSQVNSTFTGTCPLVVSEGPLWPASTVAMVAGLSIAKQTATSLYGVNLASSGNVHPMNQCRLYYPQVKLKPETMLRYIDNNHAKRVCYTSILSSQYQNIPAGGTYSQLVQSGVRNIKGVLIIPFISQTTNGILTNATVPITGISPFSDIGSPFSCAPMQTGPISLINLQVKIGNVNVVQNFIQYNFEDFLEQVAPYNKINGSTFGIKCGLLDSFYYENAYRPYYINCERGTDADNATLRNVEINFTNNCSQVIDIYVYVEYYQELVIDVTNGMIKKL